MDLAQTAVNILYMLRDYAPLALVLALAVLPYELYAHEVSSTLSADLVQHSPVLRVHRALLLIAWFCNKLWYLVFYNHVGLSRVWYFQSNEIWAAPCKWQSRLLTPLHSMYIHLTQESRMLMKLTTGVYPDMAYRCCISFLPSALNTPSFDVCGAVPASERSVRLRPTFFARCLNINFLMWISYAMYASVPLLLHAKGSGAVWLLPGPMLKLVGVVLKMLVPVKYVLFPPDMPARASMLAVDEKGVKRVKRIWKESGEKKEEWGVWSLIAGVELGCWLMLCGFI